MSVISKIIRLAARIPVRNILKGFGVILTLTLPPLIVSSQDSIKSILHEWSESCSIVVSTKRVEDQEGFSAYEVRLFPDGKVPPHAIMVLDTFRPRPSVNTVNSTDTIDSDYCQHYDLSGEACGGILSLHFAKDVSSETLAVHPQAGKTLDFEGCDEGFCAFGHLEEPKPVHPVVAIRIAPFTSNYSYVFHTILLNPNNEGPRVYFQPMPGDDFDCRVAKTSFFNAFATMSETKRFTALLLLSGLIAFAFKSLSDDSKNEKPD